ncbi:hypothetical protein F5I97DRAFT_2076061 [Phlebopus sp. FC_14]|nr:hypothetical protein F5I97DRAFT_2076061 [Phlebopus sp. FC_14]
MEMESWDKGLGKGTSCNFLIHSGLEFGLTILQAKFHRVKRDVIDDVRQVFPHGQILNGALIRREISLRVVARGSESDYHPDPRMTLTMLWTRNEVKRQFRREITAITEEEIADLIRAAEGRSVPTREEAIRALIKGKLKLMSMDVVWPGRTHAASTRTAVQSWKKLYDRCSSGIATLRIPLDDLCYFRPGTRDVHEKMMWASTRTTTRIEDIAYCLTGIFGVSMTIAYGEGKRAFYRLMEAIIHRCGEWQIMAWAGQPSADSAALPESPRCFRQLASHPDSSTGSGECEQKAWRGDRNYVRRVAAQSYPRQHSLEICTLYEGAGDGRKECTRYGQCTVGVDYWCYDTSGQGVLKPSQDHLCLLLRMDPFDPFAEW